MVSESLSSSSASTIPSVLEISDHEEKQSTGNDDASVNYADEQFESDNDHVDDSADPVLVKSSSSNDKYASDEFEDDHEANDPPASAETLEAEGGENHTSTEEGDYTDESFEQEEMEPGDDAQEQVLTPVTQEVICQDTDEQQQQQPKSQMSSIEGEAHTVEDRALSPVANGNLHPQVGAWCSKMIQELRDRPTNKSRQPQERKTEVESVADKIPAAAVDKLIRRATQSHGHRRPPQQRNSRQHSCQKVKVPTSLILRAQTQRWLATSARETSNDHETAPPRPALPTSARFCSVKREKLLGKLATLRLSQSTERWAAPESGGFCLGTLEFVQNMAARQREIYCTCGKEPGGRLLHRVTVETRLQLEESIALRRQAEVVLEDS